MRFKALEQLWKQLWGMCCTRAQLGLCPSPCPVKLCISDLVLTDLLGWKIHKIPQKQQPPKFNDLTTSAGIAAYTFSDCLCDSSRGETNVFALGLLLWEVRNRVSFNP